MDQDAWNELCDLYLSEQEYAKAAFCMEELILQNPHNHLFHLRFAEIKYTQVQVNFPVSLSIRIHENLPLHYFREDLIIWNWPCRIIVKHSN